MKRNIKPLQISVLVVHEFLKSDPNEEEAYLCCSMPEDGQVYWDAAWEKEWSTKYEVKLGQFLELADTINRCIWQIDNSWAIEETSDTNTAIEKLHEYRLIHLGSAKNIEPASTLETVNYIFAHGTTWRDREVQDAVYVAIENKRWDILKALEVGMHPPVDRQSYWQEKYRQALGTGENYWNWKANPESREICPELRLLLSLPEPNHSAMTVLRHLKEGIDPFYSEPTKRHETPFGIYVTFGKYGKLGDCKPEIKRSYREAFREWHLEAMRLMGKDVLEDIYKVCFRASWTVIEETLAPTLTGHWSEILGISERASEREIKKAYRETARLWHPDINKTPAAHDWMVALNCAYEQAIAQFTPNTPVRSRSKRKARS